MFVYRRGRAGGWEASGYINLMKLRDSYVIPQNVSAVETLIGLTPGRV